MRVIPDCRKHSRHILRCYMVKIHERHPRIPHNMLLLLATTEEHRHGVAWHVLLLSLGTGGVASRAVAAMVIG